MIKIIFIFINVSLSILLLSLITWFQIKEDEIKSVNSKHASDTYKLKKISNINKLIEEYILPTLTILPETSEKADLNLVEFFDKHAKDFHFKVSKYIFSDTDAHYMKIAYILKRTDKKKLDKFLRTKFESGFIEFTEFNIKDEIFKGEILLIQPYKGEVEDTDQEGLEDVPE